MNQILKDWDARRVTTMKGMFSGCKNFNHELNDWDINGVTNRKNMFKNAP